MPESEIEIVVDDPTAPEADSPAVTSIRIADVTVSLLLLALALTLGFDNWRTGIAWDSTGPQAGYFPFYLSVILAGASLYGILAAFLSRREAAETFVTRSFKASRSFRHWSIVGSSRNMPAPFSMTRCNSARTV